MYYEAIYKPRETAKLCEKARVFLDKKIAIQELGQREVAKNKKQVFYTAMPYFGMIPNYDLTRIKSIPYWRWKDLGKDAENELS